MKVFSLFQASDHIIHDLARSTDANTELNGFHETAVTAAALRINKPPVLGCEKTMFFDFDANNIYTQFTQKFKYKIQFCN